MLLSKQNKNLYTVNINRLKSFDCQLFKFARDCGKFQSKELHKVRVLNCRFYTSSVFPCVDLFDYIPRIFLWDFALKLLRKCSLNSADQTIEQGQRFCGEKKLLKFANLEVFLLALCLSLSMTRWHIFEIPIVFSSHQVFCTKCKHSPSPCQDAVKRLLDTTTGFCVVGYNMTSVGPYGPRHTCTCYKQ